jgi:archaellum component FlaD/FlaE
MMTIDPGDYDPRELRGVDPEGADPGSAAEEGALGSVSARDELRSRQRQTLQMIEDTLDELSSPYLAELPDSYRGELLILEWLELLVETAGRGETIEGLDYYTSVDWITSDVESELRVYLRGVDIPPEDDRPLDHDDHSNSLVYIARLAAMTQ